MVTGCEFTLLSQRWNWCSSLSRTESSSHCVSVSRWTAGGSAACNPENYGQRNISLVSSSEIKQTYWSAVDKSEGQEVQELISFTHLQLCIWLQISICECKQWLQYHLLGQGAISICCRGWVVKEEQQSSSDHQSFWEDIRSLVEGLSNATDIIIQQPAVELRTGV